MVKIFLILGGEMRMLRRKKGQSTLEYMVLISVLVAFIIWAAINIVKGGVTRSWENAETAVERVGEHIGALEPAVPD